MNCPNCGYKLVYDDRFCMRCGKPVPQQTDEDNMSAESMPQQDIIADKKPNKKSSTSKEKRVSSLEETHVNKKAKKGFKVPAWAYIFLSAVVVGSIAGLVIRFVSNRTDSSYTPTEGQLAENSIYIVEATKESEAIDSTAVAYDNSYSEQQEDVLTEVEPTIIPVISTPIPTEVPTEIPTEMPTVVPTTVPTTAPTAVPLTELSNDLEYKVEITGDKVNVRTSPDTGGSIIKPGDRGDTFTLIDQSIGNDGNVWYNISNQAGQTGWVSSQYSKIIIAAKATPTPVSDESSDDDFDNISWDDFVPEFEEYVEDNDFSQVFIDDSMADENDGYMGRMEIVDCDSWVSLRSKPDKKSSRLAKVPLGALVETWAYNSEFYKCVYEGKTGYILAQYIGQPDIEEQVENGTWESDFYVYATAGGRYYHIDSSCSGMKNASRYLLSDMYNQDKPACPVCFPEADTVVYGEPGNPYYHSYSGCSDMSDPMEDTLVGAILVGLKKCPICW